MKTILIVLSLLVLQTSMVQAQDLRTFLKSCAWGTLGGAAAGVVSLALTDKPGSSWSNVAKGASLGLYAGIGYGLYQVNKAPEMYQQPEYSSGVSVFPQIANGKVEGVQVSGVLLNF